MDEGFGVNSSEAHHLSQPEKFDVQRVRQDFPILSREVHGKPLVYLDNAATGQRPEAVIAATSDYYRRHNANVHRAVHTLGDESTTAYEGARDKAVQFVNAHCREEIVFLRGVTEGVNLVAQAFARPRLQPGDVVLVTHMEHHSNFVPWQMVCQQTGAEFKVIPVTEAGELDLDALDALLDERVKLLAMVHISNALGTINPVAEVCRRAHAYDIPVLVDGAQAAPHIPVDVQALGCDFYCISGHKMFAPTGAGCLWARKEILEAMPPWMGGGEMISEVYVDRSVYAEPPARFEAGTPNIAGAVGLAAAMEYLMGLDREGMLAWENQLRDHALEVLGNIEGLRIIGHATDRAAVVSFVLEDVHAHDLGTILDHQGIAIRTGHHCAMPLMHRFGLNATSRASMAFYNTLEEIDALAQGLLRARQMFA